MQRCYKRKGKRKRRRRAKKLREKKSWLMALAAGLSRGVSGNYGDSAPNQHGVKSCHPVGCSGKFMGRPWTLFLLLQLQL